MPPLVRITSAPFAIGALERRPQPRRVVSGDLQVDDLGARPRSPPSPGRCRCCRRGDRGSSGVPGGTSSSPVLMTASRTRERTATSGRFAAARAAQVPGREAPRRPAAAARRRHIDPASRTKAPAPRPRRISTPPSTSRVSSIGTTASAPAGIGAPVMIATADPAGSGAGSVCTRRDLAVHGKDDRDQTEVSGAHGVPVHLGVAERRQVDRTPHLRGGHPVGRERDRHRLGRPLAERGEQLADERGVLLDGDAVHGFSIGGRRRLSTEAAPGRRCATTRRCRRRGAGPG